MSYKEIYTAEYFNKCDGFAQWQEGVLKCGDALAAIAYAHGIGLAKVNDYFPGTLKVNKVTNIKLNDQLEFIQRNKTRSPKKILGIGAGRGEVGFVRV